MNQNLKSILYAIGFAAGALLLANCVFFLIEVYKNGLGESWSFKFDQGTFSKNGEILGVPFGSSKGNKLMIFAFVYSLFRAFRSGKLTF